MSATERELIVEALAGRKICPRHHLPCWVCTALHVLTGSVRSVTLGRFDRFQERKLDIFEPWFAEPWLRSDPYCVHHRWASGDNYWNTPQASTTDPRELSYETVGGGP